MQERPFVRTRIRRRSSANQPLATQREMLAILRQTIARNPDTSLSRTFRVLTTRA